MLSIDKLWRSPDSAHWDTALERYWEFVRPENRKLERALDVLKLDRIRKFNADEWYDFLRHEYFRWKYTAKNRYATTTKKLAEYETAPNGKAVLDTIRTKLLNIEPTDVEAGLKIAKLIKGLGTSGASGLLSLMYPATFATVDQFVVKALREVGDLPEAAALEKMKPESLTLSNGATLIRIMTRKASENNALFSTTMWTPRKIDQVLWTYGR